MNGILEGVAAVLMVVGASMSLAAAIGLFTFPDLLTRMHAATKPQVFGLLLLLLAVALALRAWALVPLLVLMWIFQLLTIPVGGHMVARAGYRTRHLDRDSVVIDELRDVVQGPGAGTATGPGNDEGGSTAVDPPSR
ncbi:monovalent cation/H(+) antiporter subunit G [Tersicoccus sp. MR15.9]|uniref:monovalent cation/H(+) antiporter subunit G n=1 Tax=Tersicoccus mangrovi TaxID=3121635 RepID=UPI002FE5C2C5